MEEQKQNIEQEYTPVPHEEIIKPKKDWLLIARAIVLFLVLAGCGVFWWAQQRVVPVINDYQPDSDVGQVVDNTANEDETNKNNQVTYVDNDLGIVFEYPEKLKIQEYDGGFYLRDESSWPQRGTSLYFKEVDGTLEKYIDDYNKSDVTPDGLALAKIVEQIDYTIGDTQAVLLKGSTALGITNNIIFVVHNDRNYTISFMDYATDEELQILESFKFLENNIISVDCLPEQRKADFCIEIYQPVCATVNVQCIKAPCPPIEQTFGNSCQACMNELVSSYTMGECGADKK